MLLGSPLCFFEAVGLAVDGQDLGVVDEAVDQRDDAGSVGEDLAPLGERAVGCDDGAVALVTAADELEQEIGVAVGIGEISDLIDGEEVGVSIVAQAPTQRGIAVECGEIAEQLSGAGEQHGVSVDHGLMGEVAGKR